MKRAYYIVILLFAAVCSAQTNYYVNGTSGSNSNNGLSPSTAWKTIQKACNSATPNSIVHIKGGTYHENLNLNVSGTPGNPIIFTNYQNDTVILDGEGVSGSVMLNIIGKSYVTFENMLIQNRTDDYAKGINVEAGSGSSTALTFRNIIIKDINWTDDPETMPGNSDNAWGLKVKGQVGGVTALTIENCKIYGNILGYSEALVIAGNVDGFLVKDCEIHDNTNIGIDIIGHNNSSSDPETDFPRNGYITGNIVYRNGSPVAHAAGIYIDGGQNITIEKNACFENQMGIEVGCEEDGVAQYITVKNNLIYNNEYTGLAVGGYTEDTTGEVLYSTFRNNTFFKNNSLNTGMGEITVSKASNCVFENNLIYTNNQNILLTMLEIEPQENNLVNYNCWYTPSGNTNNITIYWVEDTYHSMSAYKTNTGQDLNSIFTNPAFNNMALPQPDLTVLATSQTIDHGNPVLQIPSTETDFDGNPRKVGSAIDIGAREFNPLLGIGIVPEIRSMAAPNPFSSQTNIRTMIEMLDATLELYDVSGRLMRQIGKLSGYDIALDKENLTAGLYLYRILQGSRIIGSGKLTVR